ncbi:LarC family nickel insertion protein [Desulforamulus aquiferis]|uniref:LarC family nickel insertion protein n=1 Tax=Desulforamulus aquiferis TaxID=1397668 RepID=A0AAW7ZFM6_9FIRM|nr:LarC family nickel insertion protein [Desulforamulus aquiferis]MDO7788172.1 LarC family nickel insertion protein [Desulforamulus aquiferis]
MVLIKILYFDCINGLTEDMMLGALLQTGFSEIYLEKQLSCLNAPPCEIRILKEGDSFISNRFVIDCQQEELNLFQILWLIDETTLSSSIKEKTKDIFTCLAKAKSNISGIALDLVSIPDAIAKLIKTIGIQICTEQISPEKVLISSIPVKTGSENTPIGNTYATSPEVLELLKGFPIKLNNNLGQVTSLGASIARTLVNDFIDQPDINLLSLGYGRDNNPENMLRVLIGETSEDYYLQDQLAVLETNIDDMNPEFYPFVLDRLLSNGALDVYYTPIVMKKGRPGTKLTTICRPEDVNVLTGIIFSETTSLGVRISYHNRKKLSREIIEVYTCYGSVRVKVARLGHNQPVFNIKPEYEDCNSLARQLNIPVNEIYQEAFEKARNKYKDIMQDK